MKLFLVDDDSVYRFVVKTLLKKISQVEKADFFDDAESAIDALSNFNKSDFPDVFLIDINMHALDGWDVLDKIYSKVRELGSDPRVFMVSSSLLNSDMEKAREHLVKLRGYLIKPINLEKLSEILEYRGEEFIVV